MIRILAGSNWFGVKHELDNLVNEFAGANGELAVEKISGVETNLAALSGALQSVSMFQDQKLVVINDLSENKQLAESIEQIIGMVNDPTSLIIVEGKLDKRSNYYKTIKKITGFQEFGEMSEGQLVAWVSDYVKIKNGTISRSNINLLIARVGANQTLLERELEKLTAYNPDITTESIEQLSIQTPTSSIFNLVDMIFSKNAKDALKIYDEQRNMKVEPQAIVGMLVWQIHIVAVCAAAGNKTASQISSDSGISSYAVGKAQNIARNLGTQKIKEFLDLLTEMDIKSKSRVYDLDQALKYAITSIAN